MKAETMKLYATLDEAKANKPASKSKWELWSVSHAEKGTRWCWSDGATSALRLVARADGYTARPADKPVNRTAVAGMLAALSAEDREALLAQYAAPASNGTAGTPAAPAAPAPSVTTPAGKKRN